MTTTIKVSVETRDRLKAQAAAAHRTLGDHLTLLADQADRAARFESLRRAIAARPPDADYAADAAAWERAEAADTDPPQ